MSCSVAPGALRIDRLVGYISAFTSVEGDEPEAPHVVSLCVCSDVRITDIVSPVYVLAVTTDYYQYCYYTRVVSSNKL